MKNTTNDNQILSPKFICSKCDYKCCKKGDFNKHLQSIKHNKDDDNTTNIQHMFTHICHCGKAYNHRATLYNHKKNCITITNTNTVRTNIEIDKEMLIKMLLKNQDIMEKIVEILPNIGNNSHNTNNNSHNTTNNQFNIQMFLNEHCKNAMNLTDFIDSLPITAATYDSTIENGLTKTITNMITNGLSKLDILERPIHCTDATRKTLYVKESNVWEKDTELLKVVAGITNLIRKKRTLISRWKEVNEGWDTIERKQIKFTELVCNIMTDIEYDEKETGKIVRSISKTVYLDNEEKKKYIC
jgi:hypothetical protein